MKTYITPIHISPTKPWSIGVLHYLLLIDSIYKGTKFVYGDTRYLFSRKIFESSSQVLRLISYIRKVRIGTQIRDDIDMGKLYVEVNSSPENWKEEEVIKLRKEFESNRECLKETDCVYKKWEDISKKLNLYDPGFLSENFNIVETEAIIEILKLKNIILDVRSMGSGLFLDLTDEGIPLRKITGSDIYDNNYVLGVLRLVLGNTKPGDRIVHICDNEQTSDFVLLSKILSKFDRKVSLVVVQRMKINGETISGRKGNWQGNTVDDILSVLSKQYSISEISLGLRIFFFAVYRGSNNPEFKMQSLIKFLARARSLIYSLKTIKTCKTGDLRKYLLSSSSQNEMYYDPSKAVGLLLANETPNQIKKGIIKYILS